MRIPWLAPLAMPLLCLAGCPGPEPQALGAGASSSASATGVGANGAVTGSGGTAGGPASGVGGSGASAGGGSGGTAGAAVGGNGGAATDCGSKGFTFPDGYPPTGPNFQITFQSLTPHACIDIEVTCAGSSGLAMGFGNDDCEPGYCWHSQVTECEMGAAQITFVKDKNTGAGCRWATSAGVVVETCTVQVQ
jgi:hypothetical protein